MFFSKISSKKLFFYSLILLILIINSIPAFADPISIPKNILILQSYNKGHNWTDGQNAGIINALKKSKLETSIYVEYMDWKRFPNKENLQQLYETYKVKYRDKKIDLIITTDDAALKFALANRKELFSSASIVFSGVLKSSADILLKNEKAVTGVYEAMDPEETIKEALKVYPKTKEFYVINDQTESGINTGEIMMKALEKEAKNIKATSLSGYSFIDMLIKISHLNKNSLILLASYNTDVSGQTFSTEEFARILSNRSSVPIFTLDEALLGNGVIGGSVLSANLQGSQAGVIASEILKGKDINTIPIVNKKTVYSGYDYNVLKKFNVNMKNLPKDSKILNKPFSFFENYKGLVILVAFAFFLMLVFIWILERNIFIRKKAEDELRKNNDELTSLYEEVYSSEETLQDNIKELRISEERYRMVAESTQDIIWELDVETKKIKFSNKIEEILGYNNEEISTFDKWSNLVDEEDYKIVEESINNAKDMHGDIKNCEYRIVTKSGEIKWIHLNAKCIYDQEGAIIKLVGAFSDITETKKQQEKINNLAYYDIVTGLPNRVLLNEIANIKIEEYEISKDKFALFFIDLDNFKLVNDSFGHDSGDKLLYEVGIRLKELEYKNSRVFRLGGDEFIFLLDSPEGYDFIEKHSNKILNKISKPYFINNKMYHISASIGIAVFPEDGLTYKELLKNVDTAMYKSKDIGKGTFTFFNRTMGSAAVDKINIQSGLHRALQQKEFVLYYQPIIDVESMKIKGLEALIRWKHPKKGIICPDKFINVAEDTGMIVPIGKWVMKNACQYAKTMYDLGYRNFYISINVSTIQLIQKDFIEFVELTLEEVGIPSKYIIIEITESVLMNSFEIVINKLKKLKNMGVEIALDDFGSGYSSLTYLKELPISIVKIDKSFMEDIKFAEDEHSLTGSIISLAKQIGLRVIVEGVEQVGQLEYLQKHNCQMFQGYYSSKPVPERLAQELMNKFNADNVNSVAFEHLIKFKTCN